MIKFTEEQGNNLIKLYAYAAEQPDTTWIRDLRNYKGRNKCGACFCLAGHGMAAFGVENQDIKKAIHEVFKMSGVYANVIDAADNDTWKKLYAKKSYSPYDEELGDASEKITALHRINRHLGMPQGMARLFAETATAPGHQYAKSITDNTPEKVKA